jgi:hypothetical protein
MNLKILRTLKLEKVLIKKLRSRSIKTSPISYSSKSLLSLKKLIFLIVYHQKVNFQAQTYHQYARKKFRIRLSKILKTSQNKLNLTKNLSLMRIFVKKKITITVSWMIPKMSIRLLPSNKKILRYRFIHRFQSKWLKLIQLISR